MTSIDAMAAAQKAAVEANTAYLALMTSAMEKQGRETLTAVRAMASPGPATPAAPRARPAPAAGVAPARGAVMAAVFDRIRNLPTATPLKRAAIKAMLLDEYGMDPEDIAALPTDIPSLLCALTACASE